MNPTNGVGPAHSGAVCPFKMGEDMRDLTEKEAYDLSNLIASAGLANVLATIATMSDIRAAELNGRHDKPTKTNFMEVVDARTLAIALKTVCTKMQSIIAIAREENL